MLLSAAEFDKRRVQGQLRIALIGMSNIGKSYTAQRIAKTDDFACYDVDAQIQAKLGKTTLGAMAKWMGHPFTDGYFERSEEYLKLEAEISLAANQSKGNLALDTTGSVIHIANNDIMSLKNNYLVIYIKASEADIETLVDRYFKFPKPTIWGDSFRAIDGKPNLDSLLICYPDLLEIRAKLYANLADITIEAADLANPQMADEDIIPLIRSYLV